MLPQACGGIYLRMKERCLKFMGHSSIHIKSKFCKVSQILGEKAFYVKL